MRPFSYCKLEIFLPASHLSPLETALRQVDAGHIGNYDSCLSYSYVTGCWRPLKGSSPSYSPVTSCWRPLAGTTPYLGTQGALSREQELKVEVTCQTERVAATVPAIRAVHPYEEPVINVIPLYQVGL